MSQATQNEPPNVDDGTNVDRTDGDRTNGDRKNADGEDTAQLLELERRRFEAVVQGDFDAFARYCHPDLVYTHTNGGTDSLSSYLQKCRDGVFVYHSIEHPVDRVVLAGDTALVVGQMQAQLSINGVDKTLDNYSLAVWVRTKDGWKLLAYQPTPKLPAG
ncbi:nuclear transport factor 2 family protein [Kineococcus sp. SYSU DK003]|uniref:nuclear transport factor 2 family protein n=1 Tax=Kineococcus sp. SYSU DK003 TaxID=3383124 RepID=UPI003D7EBB2A